MEKNKQELQQKYMELKSLEQQINQIQQQIAMFNNQIAEFTALIQNLKNIKKTKDNTEMFSPLGAGIFIKTEVKDTKRVLMNVGANTHVTKSIDEATKLVEKQIEEMKKAVKELESNLQKAPIHAQQLQQEIMTLTAKTK